MTADLKAIRARLAAATPGPWHAWDRGIGYEVHKGAERDCLSEFGTGSEHCDELNDGFRETFARGDADLIAHAPADLAALCDEVERLQAGREVEREMIRNAVSLLTEWEAADRRVRALHTVADCGDATCEHCKCHECGWAWPCPTLRALGEVG